MGRLRRVLLVAFLALIAWLAFAPTAVEPVAWDAPAAPSLADGPYAANSRLRGIERLAAGFGVAPETVIAGADGRLYTGYLDGRIASFAADGGDPQVVANTGGRPLGLAFHPDGRLIVADARRGLLRVARDGAVEVLSGGVDGAPFGFPDFVAVDRAGAHAYFSDASRKWRFGQHVAATIEHGGDGRLLRYDFADGSTHVLLDGLQFANGVALAPDESFVLVDETTAYRIARLWLTGPKAGQRDLFADNLPGFPDNLSCNGRDRFWVALPAPRDALLDALSDAPHTRRVLARVLERFPGLKPLPRRSLALAFDLDGRLVANLQDATPNAYAQVTHVQELGPWLYFGSLTEQSIGRIARPGD